MTTVDKSDSDFTFSHRRECELCTTADAEHFDIDTDYGTRDVCSTCLAKYGTRSENGGRNDEI